MFAAAPASAQDQFLDKLTACQDAYREQHYLEAESLCGAAVKLADSLPAGRKNDRVTVHAVYAQVFLAERKFPEALIQAEQELSIAESFMKPDQPDLAYVHYHAALAFHMNGKSDPALANYKAAEEILRQAIDHTSDEYVKDKYVTTLKQVLHAHAGLLKQTNHATAAAALDREAAQLH